MIVPRIYIDGVDYNIDNKTVIALSVQAFSFSDPLSIRSSYTNRISLPLTSKNKSQLEMMCPLNVITTKPYNTHAVRIVKGAFEIIPNGVCQIIEVKDRILIDVQSNVKGFFNALTNKYLTDIDTSDVGTTWNQGTTDTLRAATSGLAAPIADYSWDSGSLQTSYISYLQDMVTTPFPVNILRPMLFVDYLIGKVCSLVGFNKAGALLTDANYLALAMPLGLVQDPEWLKRKEGNISIDTITIAFNIDTQIPLLSVLNGNADGNWDMVNDRYIVNGVSHFGLILEGVFYYTTTGAATFGTLTVLKNGVAIGGLLSTAISPNAQYFKTNTVIAVAPGDIITFKIKPGGAAGNLIVSGGKINSTTDKTTDTYAPNGTVSGTAPTSSANFAKLLPRILIQDFLKAVLSIFDGVVKEKGGTIYFATMESIINDPVPVDWSHKVVSGSDDDVNFQQSNLFQSNIVQWVEDLIGNSTFAIANTTLDPLGTFLKSIANSSEENIIQSFVSGIKAARIPVFGPNGGIGNDVTLQQAKNVNTRFVLVRAKDGGEPALYYSGGVIRNDYKVAYFMDSTRTFNLHWQTILSTYYKQHQRVLNAWKAVPMNLALTDYDVYNFDPFKPVHIKGEKYIVNKINAYTTGKATPVDLIKI